MLHDDRARTTPGSRAEIDVEQALAGFLACQYGLNDIHSVTDAAGWDHAASALFCANSTAASRLTERPPIRAITSVGQARGSTSFNFAVEVSGCIASPHLSPRPELAKSHDVRPAATRPSECSAVLLVKQVQPYSKKRANVGHWLSI